MQRWLALNTTRTQNEHEPTELRNATANRPGPEEPPEAAAAKAYNHIRPHASTLRWM